MRAPAKAGKKNAEAALWDPPVRITLISTIHESEGKIQKYFMVVRS